MNPPPDPRDRVAWRRWHDDFNASYDWHARRSRRRWLLRVAGASLVLVLSAGALVALALHSLSQ